MYPVFLPYSEETYDFVSSRAFAELVDVYQIADKQERQNADDAVKDRVKAELVAAVEAGGAAGGRPQRVLRRLQVRHEEDRARSDPHRGRPHRRPRPRGHPPAGREVQVIPRVHGSAIFQRGETQILGVTTLNMLKMEQQIDSLSPTTSKRYMHHYNFPPYSTGETGRVGSPKRREIGHGFLAERASCRCCRAARSSRMRSVRSPRLSVQRIHVDGLRLRVHPVAAERRGAAARSGRGHRDGPRVRPGRR